jgi:hypothetical protein
LFTKLRFHRQDEQRAGTGDFWLNKMRAAARSLAFAGLGARFIRWG